MRGGRKLGFMSPTIGTPGVSRKENGAGRLSPVPVPRMRGMSDAADLEASLRFAARAVDEAEALVITAGAGMGVDSGLPDFRGPEGFWNAYPAFRELGLRFEQLANPEWFFDDPALAWGFYGHRLNLYRRTVPHEGFATLLRWAAEKPLGAFVFTSNVDGQFQKAGFPENRIVECHGSIHFLQCLRSCGEPIRSAAGVDVEIDEATCRARPPLPVLPVLPRPRPPEHPDVRRHGLGRHADRRAARDARELARRREGAARRPRARCGDERADGADVLGAGRARPPPDPRAGSTPANRSSAPGFAAPLRFARAPVRTRSRDRRAAIGVALPSALLRRSAGSIAR